MPTSFARIFNLHTDEENKEKVLESVKKSVSFSGPNLWILALAILIASIGLNLNSVAVIIGAMLISPLMGPIVAAGFALGMYDFDLLKRSVRNLGLATLTGLIVSTLYFWISPFKEVQSEILARTSPTIYDIFIALLGGLVGVIAITRMEKGNPIPGVAIATALMPPLCTAGYGLATGNLKYFGGALFLYVINCVFICIATYTIVKILKYPIVTHIQKKNQIKIRNIMATITIIMILPSTYFAVLLYERQKYDDSINKFIQTEFTDKGDVIIFKKTDGFSNPKTLELAFLNDKYNNEDETNLNEKLKIYDIKNTKLTIKHDDSSYLINDMKNEVNQKDSIILQNNNLLNELQQQVSNNNNLDNKKILNEIRVFIPTIESISISKQKVYSASDTESEITSLIYSSKAPLTSKEETDLLIWSSSRLNTNNVHIFRQNS
ncbi:MAG: hypothetical protein QG614_245 [Patescibacteria group bacterium]|nr:hypothetical protein [Patescibacteria group bacterium]